MIKVLLPPGLEKFANARQLEGLGSNLLELLANLEVAAPGLKGKILNDKREILNFIVIFVNGQDVRMLDGHETELKQSDEVKIFTALAGG